MARRYLGECWRGWAGPRTRRRWWWRWSASGWSSSSAPSGGTSGGRRGGGCSAWWASGTPCTPRTWGPWGPATPTWCTRGPPWRWGRGTGWWSRGWCRPVGCRGAPSSATTLVVSQMSNFWYSLCLLRCNVEEVDTKGATLRKGRFFVSNNINECLLLLQLTDFSSLNKRKTCVNINTKYLP